jgi:hippurate hydrolase
MCLPGSWKVPSVFWFVGGIDRDAYAKAEASGRTNEEA